MLRIKAVVFDYGNVLSMPQQPGDIESMAEVCNLPPAVMEDLYWRFREAYDLKELDGRAYWEQVASAAGIALSAEQIARAIDCDNQSWARPCRRMLGWVQKLRENSIRTAVLSNMPIDLRTHLSAADSWMPPFDHMTFSCELGLIKPDAQIYRHCLKGLGLPADQVLFLDDRLPNVEGARKEGMHSELYDTFENAAANIPLQYALPAFV